MSGALNNDLAILLDLFKSGGWNDFRIDTPALSVRLSNDPRSGDARPTTSVTPLTVEAAPPEAAPVATRAAPAVPVTSNPSWRAVIAPNLGTFYRSPKPGSAPFVEIGDMVTADTEICLLEVMKLFTSVTAGVAGVVRAIVARDAELVEGGQILFHIEPQES
jgi:acetyl-CoA carboxylase biotin carboxyl carrier protein